MIHLLSLTSKSYFDLPNFIHKIFSPIELMILNDQLETYIIDMHFSSEFSELKGISDPAQKMVETKRHIVYPLVSLALVLLVATTTV